MSNICFLSDSSLCLTKKENETVMKLLYNPKIAIQ